jgi:hypothetical protein
LRSPPSLLRFASVPLRFTWFSSHFPPATMHSRACHPSSRLHPLLPSSADSPHSSPPEPLSPISISCLTRIEPSPAPHISAPFGQIEVSVAAPLD